VNKAELVAQIAKKAKLSKADAERALNATLETIKLTLKKGEDVTLVGFGGFKVKKRAATTGRNPQTGAAIKIPAKKVVQFKVGKELKEAVGGKKK